ncbi:EutN/CcmL family microcompartment protein [Aeoliella mucimassa]|uniref:Ethanolamine utilization protein EutN/carboxysome n=1 Tax=Aeoliella mucimassa TaxID=2527972 RepID=A0A518APZ6_9BACT|nr:EutN/CcmL family microcompartment protein [Aeoliella mucimassa]QDU56786.1 Ethanolamine utilization protein EutN/carboxysome [Aeoliella mucimassa]
MRIAKVIGNVVLSRSHPDLAGGSLRLAIPMTLDELRTNAEPAGEELVVWDYHGAGLGSLIALSESGEAAQPFRPQTKPVDAYNSAILDTLRFDR